MADEFKGLNKETLRNVESIKSSMLDISKATASANQNLSSTGAYLAAYQSSYRAINASADKFSQIQLDASKSAKATTEAFKEQQKQLSVVRSINAQIDNLYQSISTASADQAKLLKQQIGNLASARDNAKELAGVFSNLVDDSAKLDKSTKYFSALSEVAKDIPGLRKLASPFEAASKAARETVINNLKNKVFLEEALKTGQGLTKEKIKQLGLEKEAAGLTGSAAAKRLRDAGVTGQKSATGAGLKAGIADFKESALGGVAAMTSVAGILTTVIKFFVDAMFGADKRVTEIAKNLSISKDAARGIYENIKNSKSELDTVYRTTENISEAFNDISQITDFNTLATNDQVESQIILTKQLGQSKEEALGLQGVFAVNNIEAGKGIDIVYDQIAAFGNQNKIIADGRKILSEVSKTSKLIQLNFKGNTPELVKTVLEAKKLGLTLDQVDKTANSLLNFEQSISDELSAELLLGKDLNLDKAREYALTNNIAGLTEEIANQGITAASFSNMNRIQQEAIAKVLGMQATELADSLYKSELIKKTGGQELAQMKERAKSLRNQKEDIKAIALERNIEAIEQGIIQGKELKEAQKSVDAQEKFNLALERAKDIFADMVDGGVLDNLIDFLDKFVGSIESGQSLASTLLFGPANDKKLAEVKKKHFMEQLSGAETDEKKEELKIKIAEQDAIIKKYEETVEKNYEKTYKPNEKKYAIDNAFAMNSGTTPMAGFLMDVIDKQAINEGVIPAKDYVIKTLPEDTVVGAGGTKLGRTDEMVTLLKEIALANRSTPNIYLENTRLNSATAMGSYELNKGTTGSGR